MCCCELRAFAGFSVSETWHESVIWRQIILLLELPLDTASTWAVPWSLEAPPRKWGFLKRRRMPAAGSLAFASERITSVRRDT